ncbi:hypothetical protein SAMN05216315_11032 [Nitrosospira sp. Nsp18]|nr:hypothetical protein SAMN05216315_11032 [Nitrosospira sp. Nsp18]
MIIEGLVARRHLLEEEAGSRFRSTERATDFRCFNCENYKKRRQAFISMVAGPAYHFSGSSLIRNANQP